MEWSMKGPIAALIVLLISVFCFSAFAEYYVVNPEPVYDFVHFRHHYHYGCHRHIKHKRIKRTHIFHHRFHHHYLKINNWWVKRRHCYDLDLATGDDDPCVNPNMNIDR